MCSRFIYVLNIYIVLFYQDIQVTEIRSLSLFATPEHSEHKDNWKQAQVGKVKSVLYPFGGLLCCFLPTKDVQRHSNT